MNERSQLSVRSPDILQPETSRLLIIDVQEKLAPTIAGLERPLAACRFLIEGAKLFGVPTFVTEQYPQGLGATVRELAELLPPPVTKSHFSCWPALNWSTAQESDDGRFQIVVAGIEAHVCVCQTALELQAAGYRVFVVADAVASRREFDCKIALERLSSAGITLVASESVVFEWCGRSDRPEFKALSQLVKSRPL